MTLRGGPKQNEHHRVVKIASRRSKEGPGARNRPAKVLTGAEEEGKVFGRKDPKLKSGLHL